MEVALRYKLLYAVDTVYIVNTFDTFDMVCTVDTVYK